MSPADEVPPVPNVDVFNFSGKDECQELISHFPGIDSLGIPDKKKLEIWGKMKNFWD